MFKDLTMLGTGACDKWDGALFNQENLQLKNIEYGKKSKRLDNPND